jgi:hypothetical protein
LEIRPHEQEVKRQKAKGKNEGYMNKKSKDKRQKAKIKNEEGSFNLKLPPVHKCPNKKWEVPTFCLLPFAFCLLPSF